MNNILYMVIDSVRYDQFCQAKTPVMDRLAPVERRYSFAGWTSPSHFVYLMGMTPHKSPTGVFASEIYKQDYKQWAGRIGIKETTMAQFVPEFSLPNFLKKQGYINHAKISMPIINQTTLISKYFDTYKLMPRYDDFAGMVDEITFNSSAPLFYFLNIGEAHYPYRIPKEALPPLEGENGIFRRVDDTLMGAASHQGEEPLMERYFNVRHLKYFREKQIESIEYIDGQIERLLNKCPSNTHVIITSDHGELFGEGGFFGHGPIMHEKVFEVPFLEVKL